LFHYPIIINEVYLITFLYIFFFLLSSSLSDYFVLQYVTTMVMFTLVLTQT